MAVWFRLTVSFQGSDVHCFPAATLLSSQFLYALCFAAASCYTYAYTFNLDPSIFHFNFHDHGIDPTTDYTHKGLYTRRS